MARHDTEPVFSHVAHGSSISNLYSISAPGWNYTPITEWGEGDLNIEKRIANEVATPGRQLGIIGDALVALITHLENPEKDLTEDDKRSYWQTAQNGGVDQADHN
ncbi:MAG: hypothetical protein MZW92_71115 [Comamonadaceae bacterium]|nr:hypothetical protein [Comamonadaceae bacterium]